MFIIDGNALLIKMQERQAALVNNWGPRDHYLRGFEEAVDMLMEQTILDAETVVRCKNCSFSHYLSGAKKFACRHPLYTGGNKHRGEHFCSYGERREGE